MNATIRRVVLGDEGALAELNAFVQEFHVGNKPSLFRPASRDDVSACFRSRLEDRVVRIWIAEEGVTPAGYASVLLHERAENPLCRARRWCENDQIGVRPDRQRQGIGRALVRQVLEVQRRRRRSSPSRRRGRGVAAFPSAHPHPSARGRPECAGRPSATTPCAATSDAGQNRVTSSRRRTSRRLLAPCPTRLPARPRRRPGLPTSACSPHVSFRSRWRLSVLLGSSGSNTCGPRYQPLLQGNTKAVPVPCAGRPQTTMARS